MCAQGTHPIPMVVINCIVWDDNPIYNQGSSIAVTYSDVKDSWFPPDSTNIDAIHVVSMSTMMTFICTWGRPVLMSGKIMPYLLASQKIWQVHHDSMMIHTLSIQAMALVLKRCGRQNMNGFMLAVRILTGFKNGCSCKWC